MNKLNLIVWGVPLYPLFWLIAAIEGRRLRGAWQPRSEVTRVLHEAYRQHWHNIP